MNEAERTDVQILVRAALDFIEHCANGFDVDRDESEALRDAIKRVLPYAYG